MILSTANIINTEKTAMAKVINRHCEAPSETDCERAKNFLSGWIENSLNVSSAMNRPTQPQSHRPLSQSSEDVPLPKSTIRRRSVTENINSLADSLQFMLHEHEHENQNRRPTQHKPTCVDAPSRLSHAVPCSYLHNSRRRRTTCDDAPPGHIKIKREYNRRRTCDDAPSGYDVRKEHESKKRRSKSRKGDADNLGQADADVSRDDASSNRSTSPPKGSPVPSVLTVENDASPSRKSGGERRKKSWTLNRSFTMKTKSAWKKSRRHTVDTEGIPSTTSKKSSSSGNVLSHRTPALDPTVENDASPSRKSGGERRKKSWTLNRSLTKKSAQKKSRRRTVDTEEGLSSSDVSLSLNRPSELSGPNFDLGDTLRSTVYQIIEPNPAKAVHLVQQLRIHDFAWVRRSSHEWTYGIVADLPKPKHGEEPSIRFVLDKLGHTKTFSMKHWATHIRLVDDTVAYC